MQTKNFLKSKTIIGTLIVVLSMLLPLFGVEFSAAEATTLTQKIGAVIDASSEVIGVLLILWGRITADSKLTIGAGNRLNSPWWVSVLAATVFLAGCVGQATFEDKTPVEKLRISYDTALPLITVYIALPNCGPEVVGLCSKPEVVKTLTDASAIVASYLAQLEAAEAMTDADKAAALRAAQNSLRTMLTIYAVQALTRA